MISSYSVIARGKLTPQIKSNRFLVDSMWCRILYSVSISLLKYTYSTLTREWFESLVSDVTIIRLETSFRAKEISNRSKSV